MKKFLALFLTFSLLFANGQWAFAQNAPKQSGNSYNFEYPSPDIRNKSSAYEKSAYEKWAKMLGPFSLEEQYQDYLKANRFGGAQRAREYNLKPYQAYVEIERLDKEITDLMKDNPEYKKLKRIELTAGAANLVLGIVLYGYVVRGVGGVGGAVSGFSRTKIPALDKYFKILETNFPKFAKTLGIGGKITFGGVKNGIKGFSFAALKEGLKNPAGMKLLAKMTADLGLASLVVGIPFWKDGTLHFYGLCPLILDSIYPYIDLFINRYVFGTTPSIVGDWAHNQSNEIVLSAKKVFESAAPGTYEMLEAEPQAKSKELKEWGTTIADEAERKEITRQILALKVVKRELREKSKEAFAMAIADMHIISMREANDSGDNAKDTAGRLLLPDRKELRLLVQKNIKAAEEKEKEEQRIADKLMIPSGPGGLKCIPILATGETECRADGADSDSEPLCVIYTDKRTFKTRVEPFDMCKALSNMSGANGANTRWI